jgi:hypothetical protein
MRQSPSMIVAMLALFVAMGGTAIAASSALITGKQIKNSSITGLDVKNKSLTPKDFKGSVRGPRGLTGLKGDKGDTGPPGAPNPNADTLDGIDSTGFVRPNSSEAWHEIGAAGQPAFQNTWTNESPATETTGGFYKDPLDVVHLKGIITGGSSDIFFLPDGYRVGKNACIPTWRNGAIAYLCLYPTGRVSQVGGSATGALLLDGIDFRVGM